MQPESPARLGGPLEVLRVSPSCGSPKHSDSYLHIVLVGGVQILFPTCQVRVVRFYVSCLVLLLLSSPPPLVVLLLSSSSSSSCSTATRRTVFSVGPQPRPSMLSVPCRTSTTTIHVSVPCRTSTMTIHAQCSLPDLNREYPRQKICHIECQKICQIEC